MENATLARGSEVLNLKLEGEIRMLLSAEIMESPLAKTPNVLGATTNDIATHLLPVKRQWVVATGDVAES